MRFLQFFFLFFFFARNNQIEIYIEELARRMATYGQISSESSGVDESSRSTYRRIACLIRRIERTRASTLLDRDRIVQSRTRRNSRCPLARGRGIREQQEILLLSCTRIIQGTSEGIGVL